MTDEYGRVIDYLRISVTDKCNLRCQYCMPPEGVPRLPHEELLTLEEIYRIVRIMEGMGVKKVRLTGGEPLVRKNLLKLVNDIHGLTGIEEIAMTTNGVLFGEQAADLKQAGLTGINISLDTLCPETFQRITGFCQQEKVMEAIDAAEKQRLRVKINCVPCKEFNEEDIPLLAKLARDRALDVRFIELMPLGCGKNFHGISSDEILNRLENVFGKSAPSQEKRGNGPAKYYDFAGFRGKIGFISPMSHRFCSECNRIRLTADGRLKLCLHYNQGLDLKQLLRTEASDEEIKQAILDALRHKPKEHEFEHVYKTDGSRTDSNKTDYEQRKMVQIGG